MARCVRPFVIFDIELNISYISRNPEIVRPPIPPMDKAFESEEFTTVHTTRVRNIHKIYQHKN